MGVALVLFLYGLRHGFDWDHIAAITSISGAQDNKAQRIFRSFLYILGHALVILILGSLAILFGILLPKWVDTIMEELVGVTLILLGSWMLIAYFQKKEHVHLISRGQLLFTLTNKIKRFVSRKTTPADNDINPYSSPFIIGCIHGVGAETPTQILLFLTVGQVGGKGKGMLMLLIFVTGLIFSNTIVSSVATYSYSAVKRYKLVSTVLILLSAGLSICIGIALLLGKGSLFPALISG